MILSAEILSFDAPFGKSAEHIRGVTAWFRADDADWSRSGTHISLPNEIQFQHRRESAGNERLRLCPCRLLAVNGVAARLEREA